MQNGFIWHRNRRSLPFSVLNCWISSEDHQQGIKTIKLSEIVCSPLDLNRIKTLNQKRIKLSNQNVFWHHRNALFHLWCHRHLYVFNLHADQLLHSVLAGVRRWVFITARFDKIISNKFCSHTDRLISDFSNFQEANRSSTSIISACGPSAFPRSTTRTTCTTRSSRDVDGCSPRITHSCRTFWNRVSRIWLFNRIVCGRFAGKLMQIMFKS